MEKQNKSGIFAKKCRIMKKIYNICLISAVLAFILGTDTFQAQAKQKVKYKLVFHDEFNLPDGSQPDSTIWSRDKRYPGGAYIMWLSDSKDVAFIRNHKLVCRAIKNTNPADTAAMLTGSVKTMGKFSFQYGKIEVRLRTRKHIGNFPAAWLLPEPPCQRAPYDGEIDIFEAIDDEDISYHTAHNQWTAEGHRSNPQQQFKYNVDVSKWHVYGVEWDPWHIVWTVDGTIVGSYFKLKDEDAIKHRQWPYDRPFYIILNQCTGAGYWAKKPDIDFVYETEFDWVRVYQKE